MAHILPHWTWTGREGEVTPVLSPDRDRIRGDGDDLPFVTVRIVDTEGRAVPTARDRIRFRVEGPGTLVATDNGDPTDMTPFPSYQRGRQRLALAIVRAQPGRTVRSSCTPRRTCCRLCAHGSHWSRRKTSDEHTRRSTGQP